MRNKETFHPISPIEVKNQLPLLYRPNYPAVNTISLRRAPGRWRLLSSVTGLIWPGWLLMKLTATLIWDIPKYFLLSSPPARLTTKVVSVMIHEGWIKEPQIISNDLAEYKLSEEGADVAKYLSQQQGAGWPRVQSTASPYPTP